ncbi:hypothetical protein A9Q84_06315 [Halobacteriovorax marinus]|uniref:Uncharacterized protein n=1 Tax=Halobacteriovorax marinus TaxID=97084 RepID=A0A1Y5F9I9_9BACT|nr:hypothetical protein A9Q84_06315 [Halobacteriovorax marinus]
MALNVKILFTLDHPPVSFPDKPVELSASSSELNLAKENLQKHHLLESEEDELYHNEDVIKEKISVSRRLNSLE